MYNVIKLHKGQGNVKCVFASYMDAMHLQHKEHREKVKYISANFLYFTKSNSILKPIGLQ